MLFFTAAILLLGVISKQSLSFAVSETMTATKFADSLVDRLHQDTNECSSALGVSLAISLLYPSMRAGSDIKEETENVLGFHAGEYQFRDFTLSSSQHNRAPTLSVAYSIWVDKAKKLLPAYGNSKSPVSPFLHSIDFRDASAAEWVNAWVRDATRGRIDSILPSGNSIQGDVVAISAIYLKAAWKHAFKSIRTSLDRFHEETSGSLGDGVKKVPFMHQVETFPYAEVDGYQVLQMPFVGSETLTMLVVLPIDNAPLKLFTSEKLLQSLALLIKRPVAVALPKFEFTASYGSRLESALQEMGWKSAFHGGLEIYESHSSSVDAILQKTFVRVDEVGVEAAAVTAIMTRSLMKPPKDKPILFQADRPFRFFLLDTTHVLFEGRVGSPSLPNSTEEPTGESHESENYWTNSFGVERPTIPSTIGSCEANTT